MKRMIIFLTLFFFLASFGQLIYLQTAIYSATPVNIDRPLNLLHAADTMKIAERQNVAMLETEILLETNALERRHHQASVLLMSSMWIRYLGFVTGMILAMIGAIFILGKLEHSKTSEAAAKTAYGDFSFKSASPGIILVVLGATLMIITVSITDAIQVNDAAVYLQEGNTASYSNKDSKPVILVPKEMTDVSQKRKSLPKEDSTEQKRKKKDSTEQKPAILLPK